MSRRVRTLRVGLEQLREALKLPVDCEITQVLHIDNFDKQTESVRVIVSHPMFPALHGSEIPQTYSSIEDMKDFIMQMERQCEPG